MINQQLHSIPGFTQLETVVQNLLTTKMTFISSKNRGNVGRLELTKQYEELENIWTALNLIQLEKSLKTAQEFMSQKSIELHLKQIELNTPSVILLMQQELKLKKAIKNQESIQTESLNNWSEDILKREEDLKKRRERLIESQIIRPKQLESLEKEHKEKLSKLKVELDIMKQNLDSLKLNQNLIGNQELINKLENLKELDMNEEMKLNSLKNQEMDIPSYEEEMTRSNNLLNELNLKQKDYTKLCNNMVEKSIIINEDIVKEFLLDIEL